MAGSLFHYTNGAGFHGIRSSPVWTFVASQPPGERPRGAYFTTLGRGTPLLAQKLRIPKSKVAYFFEFVDVGDLRPIRGGRGDFIFYASEDYDVEPARQRDKGRTEER